MFISDSFQVGWMFPPATSHRHKRPSLCSCGFLIRGENEVNLRVVPGDLMEVLILSQVFLHWMFFQPLAEQQKPNIHSLFSSFTHSEKGEFPLLSPTVSQTLCHKAATYL